MPLRLRCEYAAVFPRSLPGSSCPPPREFPARNIRAGARRPQPRSTRFELVPHQGGVTRRFLAYSSPSRSPDPNHLAVLARPGFVRAAPTLPGTTRIRLPSAPPSCCDRISGEGLSPPLEPQRLTAHPRPAAQLRSDPGRGWMQRPGGFGVGRTQQRRVHTDPLRRALRGWFGRGGGPSGRATGRQLEGLRQRASPGHAETEVSPERVPEPTLTARPDRQKHSEEAFRLVRGILRGWA